MSDVTDHPPVDPTGYRRKALGEWITEVCDLERIARPGLAKALGVTQKVLAEWEAGTAGMTLDEALALDRQLGVPAGTVGAAGGYFGCFATPDLEGEEVFDTREYDDTEVERMRSDLDAAVELGIGVRLANRWVPIEVDHERQSCTNVQQWVLELMTHAPAVDPFT
jgi:transcriptional regulator with XRE-family HTH domain